MTRIQELRIVSIEGLEIPDVVTEGTTLEIAATLYVSKVEQEWVDVTTVVGKPEQLPGPVTVCTVATESKIR